MRALILANTRRINKLRVELTRALAERNQGPSAKLRWESACSAFREGHRELCFPGGYERAAERIEAGDTFSIEAALCFVEVRPYFFRSGYMLKVLRRKLKKAPLTPLQSARLSAAVQLQIDWRRRRQSGAA
ncbi:hypothetical protein [Ottowia sp.]|uniref:hypothetical protein n=1 Tax=Ottowia sp. TaxID=1898956 RepID=UPI0025F71522|nr:hypothetical protein [Ottowia sp.]MBK6616161.1 hypothetical protein [Ottowia sp.]